MWTTRPRRKGKKFALKFFIHDIAPAGRDIATSAVGAAAVEVTHAEEMAGSYETMPVVGAPAVGVQEIPPRSTDRKRRSNSRSRSNKRGNKSERKSRRESPANEPDSQASRKRRDNSSNRRNRNCSSQRGNNPKRKTTSRSRSPIRKTNRTGSSSSR